MQQSLFAPDAHTRLAGFLERSAATPRRRAGLGVAAQRGGVCDGDRRADRGTGAMTGCAAATSPATAGGIALPPRPVTDRGAGSRAANRYRVRPLQVGAWPRSSSATRRRTRRSPWRSPRASSSAGYSTWYYERDSSPGLSYLLQVNRAIEACQVRCPRHLPTSARLQPDNRRGRPRPRDREVLCARTHGNLAPGVPTAQARMEHGRRRGRVDRRPARRSGGNPSPGHRGPPALVR